jgi:hypothetical protein
MHCNSPQDREELYNLRHSQARNVIERIFGVDKRKFGVLVATPEYPIETQAKLVSAVAALHNFIAIYDPNDKYQYERIGRNVRRNAGGEDSDDEDDEDEDDMDDGALGGDATTAERRRASALRDSIAQRMWDDYQRVLQQREQV